MTRYGYARVSINTQEVDHQIDALRAGGVAPEHMFVDKISGKLASRPELDRMRELLQRGDEVVVTRLRRIGRSHAHLLDLITEFGRDGVDFVVLEQGIDTSTTGGRLIFDFAAALTEYDRELIVEGTRDGLAAAKARGRVGGRPPALTQDQLDAAQAMYDADTHTVDQIAAILGVGRSTLYRKLAAPYADCVLVIYRNSRAKVDSGSHRRYGETGASETVQRDADRKWWPIADARRQHVKALVYVVDGTVARIRAVDPTGHWDTDDRGYCDVPVGPPLTEADAARLLPTLDLTIGSARAHVKGKLREYIPL